MNKAFISPYIYPGIAPKKSEGNKTQRIIDIVCQVYEVEFKSIDNKRRFREVVQVRQAIMYFLRTYTSMSLVAISNVFTNPFDHTTTIHSINIYQDVYNQDSLTKSNHAAIINKISAL